MYIDIDSIHYPLFIIFTALIGLLKKSGRGKVSHKQLRGRLLRDMEVNIEEHVHPQLKHLYKEKVSGFFRAQQQQQQQTKNRRRCRLASSSSEAETESLDDESMRTSTVRINPASAMPETLEDFVAFYGGDKEWHDALSVGNEEGGDAPKVEEEATSCQ